MTTPHAAPDGTPTVVVYALVPIGGGLWRVGVTDPGGRPWSVVVPDTSVTWTGLRITAAALQALDAAGRLSL